MTSIRTCTNNDDFNNCARMDETMTKASTPTEEHLINDRLASELSLYDDDVTFNSYTWLFKILLIFGLCNCSLLVFLLQRGALYG